MHRQPEVPRGVEPAGQPPGRRRYGRRRYGQMIGFSALGFHTNASVWEFNSIWERVYWLITPPPSPRIC